MSRERISPSTTSSFCSRSRRQIVTFPGSRRPTAAPVILRRMSLLGRGGKLATRGGMEVTPPPDQAPRREERLPFSPGVGCVVSVLGGLICAGAFFFLLWFNQQGQIVYAPEPYRATRIWLLSDVEGRGMGGSTPRPLP